MSPTRFRPRPDERQDERHDRTCNCRPKAAGVARRRLLLLLLMMMMVMEMMTLQRSAFEACQAASVADGSLYIAGRYTGLHHSCGETFRSPSVAGWSGIRCVYSYTSHYTAFYVCDRNEDSGIRVTSACVARICDRLPQVITTAIREGKCKLTRI
jgi:hypothetical protein